MQDFFIYKNVKNKNLEIFPKTVLFLEKEKNRTDEPIFFGPDHFFFHFSWPTVLKLKIIGLN
jgi:hypothetical protein